MDLGEFLTTRRPSWAKLDERIRRAEKRRFTGLRKREIDEIALAYRRLTSDLAFAQTFFPATDLARYLNGLTARAHGAIYRRRPASAADFKSFFTIVFPRSFRANRAYFMFALAAFLLSMGLGYAATYANRSAAAAFIGPHLMSYIERGEMWTDDVLAIAPPVLSSKVMTNNLGVSFLAFALGVTAGIGTLYIVVTNGLLIGIVSALCARFGLALGFWSFVLPHGILELTAIFLSAGAGLILGDAIVHPGVYGRREYVIHRAGVAATWLMGTVPILVIAALIEGFISPGDMYPAGFKMALGLAAGAVLYLYLFLSGREKTPADPSPGDRFAAPLIVPPKT